jgi:predicted deacylase
MTHLDEMFHYLAISQSSIKLPYLDIKRSEGPTVLLTAGMDGDEYAGQEAALRLCKQFIEDTSWKGRRVVFPMVNVLGNEVGLSINPHDNKYLKHIFPGNSNGSLSEQIIDSIFQYIKSPVSLWIDLHGGSSVEELNPFIWGFPYGSKKIQKTLFHLLSHVPAQHKVIAPWLKAKEVAKQGIVYIILESGQEGRIDEFAIHQHIQWVTSLLSSFDSETIVPFVYHSSVYYCIAGYTGMWQLQHKSDVIDSNDVLGRLVSFDTHRPQQIYSKVKGTFLWRHKGGWVKKGDILYAIGTHLTSKE